MNRPAHTLIMRLHFTALAAVLAGWGCAGSGDLNAPGFDGGAVEDSTDAWTVQVPDTGAAPGRGDGGGAPLDSGPLDGAPPADTRDASPPPDAAEDPPDAVEDSPDAAGDPPDAAEDSPDAAEDPPDATPPPIAREPCEVGSCWSERSFGGICGRSNLAEDFRTGRYNVHRFELAVPADVGVTVSLTPTAGAWEPALVLHDEDGRTVYDGERGEAGEALRVEPLGTGRDGAAARFEVTADADRRLAVFLTGWHVIDGGFAPEMPRDARYDFIVDTDCEPPEGEALLSPPNFDPEDVAGGYFLLPESEPAGLYTRKPDGCSRGNRLLIDVLYTVALRWNMRRPEYSPINIRDLNEGRCSDVNHSTHDDGTHADLVAGCATSVACADIQPAVELARLFIDTGQACGIIFNDVAVQAEINRYFESRYDYEPWHGTFMRSVGEHVRHFHLRVKKPDGTCN